MSSLGGGASPPPSREDEDDRAGAAAKQPAAPAPTPAAPLGRPPMSPPAPPIIPPKAGKKRKEAETFVGKLGKKEKKLQKDAFRRLDSWERYRALTDALDEAIDLVDLADHKARFALVIMAAVNVVLFFSADALNPLKSGSLLLQIVLGLYILVYVCVALYFFLQAIESLRPRQSQPQIPPPNSERMVQDFPLGIRFYEDILRRDVETYKKAWQEVRIGQLNAELAVQAHALAEINKAKYAALRKLYKGLQIMTLMAVGLVVLGALTQIVGTARKAGRNNQDSKRSSSEAEALGTVVRYTVQGLKEPSGVAFHPGRNHLYVVGDDGVLAEVDGAGRPLGAIKVEKQLEDVAHYPPSDGLVLVSEKKGELIFVDAASGREQRRIPIDQPAVLGTLPGDPNQGFEGLTFQPDAERPGGGVFYLSHQRQPAMIVGLAFDPSAATRVGAESVVSRWTTPHDDVTALTWVPTLERVLAVIDSAERILVLRPDGSVEAEFPLPGKQQEGLAFDASGALWVADDLDKSILRIDGALAAIQAGLRSSGPADLLNSKKPDILRQ
ncbi:MAG TPA: SdiA-regulated domain-containing protein [Vicinamibacteria bacterium]|nr:SdiA-regulated domain-containing protein [Vicinamibacteria bacterium]